MSTKTSIKRIALVAVSALGFGLLSVVPAKAAYITNNITSINLAKASANTYVAGTVVAVNLGAVIPSATRVVGDQTLFQAALTTYPAGGFVAVSGKLGPNGEAANTNATYPTGWAGTAVAGAGTGKLEIVASATTAGSTVTATSTTGMGSFVFTPTKAGAYELTVWHDTTSSPDGILGATEVRQTIAITVVAAAGYSASLSTVHLGAGSTAATASTDLLPVSASKTTGTQAANIRVAIKDEQGNAYTGQTVTATIAGPGLLGTANSNAAANTADTTSGSVRSTSVTDTNGFVSVTVWPDGTTGKATITISVTDKVSGATSVLGTEEVLFYGAVAKLEATVNYSILPDDGGGVIGGSVTGSTATNYLDLANRINLTDVPAVIIKATDKDGNPVGGLTIQGNSSNLAVANSWTVAGDDDIAGCKEDVLSAANLYSSGGTGYYNCALESTATAKSGDKATVSFRVKDPADPLGVAWLSVDVPVSIGGARFTETISFDKAVYAPGEAMVITRSAVDASGNPVYDTATAPEISFNKAVGGSSQTIASGRYVGGKIATSSTRPTIFAPTVSGDFLARMSGRSGSTATVQITATAKVSDTASDVAAQAAADAAAEAIDAANAATDAANLAAEAADAATVAAEEARDAADAATAAVEQLASQVATLMAALKAQITTLANTVAKIAKRVKA